VVKNKKKLKLDFDKFLDACKNEGVILAVAK
jgi:hypothetical protein